MAVPRQTSPRNPGQIADPGQAQELHLACNGEYYVPAPSGARDWKLAPERGLHENRAAPTFYEEGSGDEFERENHEYIRRQLAVQCYRG